MRVKWLGLFEQGILRTVPFKLTELAGARLERSEWPRVSPSGSRFHLGCPGFRRLLLCLAVRGGSSKPGIVLAMVGEIAAEIRDGVGGFRPDEMGEVRGFGIGSIRAMDGCPTLLEGCLDGGWIDQRGHRWKEDQQIPPGGILPSRKLRLANWLVADGREKISYSPPFSICWRREEK